MDTSLEYISTILPGRPDFLAMMTSEELSVMQQHLAYVQGLFDQGKLLLGGAATDGAIGVLVLRVGSPEEAQRIFDDDPAVRAGISHSELHPFRVRHLSGP